MDEMPRTKISPLLVLPAILRDLRVDRGVAPKRRLSFLIRPLLIWCATLLIPATIFFGPVSSAVRVLRNPVVIDGNIVALLPNYHRTAIIRYEVQGKAYQTSTSLPEDLGLAKFEEMRVGDKARITYNPQYPADGIPGDAAKLLITECEDIAMIAALLALFSVGSEIYLRSWLQKWRTM